MTSRFPRKRRRPSGHRAAKHWFRRGLEPRYETFRLDFRARCVMYGWRRGPQGPYAMNRMRKSLMRLYARNDRRTAT